MRGTLSALPRKAVILAGGLGSRLSEETHAKPKPLVEVGNLPIIAHILEIYSRQGVYEFIICLGYKGYLIKEYFNNYLLHSSDLTLDFVSRSTTYLNPVLPPWKITFVDTGPLTATGGRLKRVQHLVESEPFFFTYGDGLANVNLSSLVQSYNDSMSVATLTAAQPTGRFGSINISEDSHTVNSFIEKPLGDNSWINGGFFILNPDIFQYIEGDDSSFEVDVLPQIADLGLLSCHKHYGFWHAMDTLRDKNYLSELALSGTVPWLNN